MTNTEKKLNPKVRFKEFSDDWQVEKLEELADFSKGQGYSKSDLRENGTPIILYGRLYTKYQAAIDSVDTFAQPKEGSLYSNGNEVVVPASGETPEDIVRASAILKKNILLGGDLNIILPYDALNSYFLALSISTGKLKKDLVKRAQGKSVVHIRNNDLKEAYVNYPSPPEQKKIGTFFQNLDNLITLHQKKYDKLVILKKAMLVKMFPRDGAVVPEIRFKGFEGDWVEKRLGDMMDVTSVKRIHQSDWTDSGVRFLRARDIVSIAKNEDAKDRLYISTEKYEEYSLISGKVTKGDILVTGVGTIGVPYLVENEEPIYFKDGNIIWFKNENVIDPEFFYFSFINRHIQDFIKKSAGIGTVGTYTITSGKKTPLLFPKDENEQQVLGTYFTNLDEQITLHQTQLDKLTNIKKACFSKMFVSQD